MESNCLYSTLTDRILEISENPERMRNTYVGCRFYEASGIPTSEGTYICDVDDLYDAISQVKGYNAKIKRGRLRWFIKEVMKNRDEIVIME